MKIVIEAPVIATDLVAILNAVILRDHSAIVRTSYNSMIIVETGEKKEGG